jgi:hypothetical protein
MHLPRVSTKKRFVPPPPRVFLRIVRNTATATSFARMGENSPFGRKITFLWEKFQVFMLLMGEFWALSLFSTWGI